MDRYVKLEKVKSSLLTSVTEVMSKSVYDAHRK